MEFMMSCESMTPYVIVDTPFTIIDSASIRYMDGLNRYIVFHDYWLNHKEYGYMMHMFGSNDSFHDLWDDVDDSYIKHWLNIYMKDIRRLEDLNEESD